jgi:hypothetical protein
LRGNPASANPASRAVTGCGVRRLHDHQGSHPSGRHADSPVQRGAARPAL